MLVPRMFYKGQSKPFGLQSNNKTKTHLEMESRMH